MIPARFRRYLPILDWGSRYDAEAATSDAERKTARR